MNTLNIQRIKTAHLLAADVKKELSGAGITGKQTSCVGTSRRDTWSFNPYIAQEITLRLDRNSDLGTRGKATDEIDTLRLDRKICVTLVILAEKTYFGLTSDVHILGTLGHEVNQSS